MHAARLSLPDFLLNARVKVPVAWSKLAATGIIKTFFLDTKDPAEQLSRVYVAQLVISGKSQRDGGHDIYNRKDAISWRNDEA